MGGECLVWEGQQNFHRFRDFLAFRRINLAVIHRPNGVNINSLTQIVAFL